MRRLALWGATTLTLAGLAWLVLRAQRRADHERYWRDVAWHMGLN